MNKQKSKLQYWESVADGIVIDYNRLNAACDAAIKAGAMDPNGPLHEAIWKSFENMLKLIDVHEWIQWFIYDNECGKRALQARACSGRELTAIKTTRQLAGLIVDSEESAT